MISKSQAQYLRDLINDYAIAYTNESWKGGGDPDSWDQIERHLYECKNSLYKYIRELVV